MLVDSHADNIILALIVEKIMDMAIIKQIMGAILSMVHGPVIDERMVLPQLLKTADIVKHADKPGQIYLILGQTQASRNLLTEKTHP